MLAAVLFAALAASPSIPALPEGVFDPLERGTLGVAAVHVESGRAESLNAKERFPMASTFKLPLALALLARVDEGTFPLDAEVVVEPGHVRTGMGPQLGAGRYTIRRLLAAMMQESDNTATDALFRVVGGPAAVRAFLARHRIDGIDVSRTELEMHADFAGITVPSDGRITPAQVRRLRSGVPASTAAAARRTYFRDPRDTATPEAMATLLVRLQQGRLLSPASTAELLATMRGGHTGDARIRAGVPKGTPVSAKTGTMPGLTNDVGLVTLPDGTHLAIAVYVKGGSDREKAIAEATRAAWNAFQK